MPAPSLCSATGKKTSVSGIRRKYINGWHEYDIEYLHINKILLKTNYFQAVEDCYIGCGMDQLDK